MEPEIYGSLDSASWNDIPAGQGVQFAVLRRHANGDGATIFLRFRAGAEGAKHLHPEGEELLVISGDITIGGQRLKPGDYLYAPPGSSHQARAHADTVLLLSYPKPPVFERAAAASPSTRT